MYFERCGNLYRRRSDVAEVEHVCVNNYSEETYASLRCNTSDYKKPPFLVPQIDLDFDLISPQRANVSSKMYVKRNEPKADLVLDGVDLKLKTIALDGVDLKLERQEFQINDETLLIPLGDPAEVGRVHRASRS